MRSKPKITLLKKTIDMMGMSFRPKALEGIEEGIKSRKEATLKKWGSLTANYLMEEIRQNQAFLDQVKRLEIGLEDIEAIAQRIVTEHEQGPKVYEGISRNEPCPCGSGKKYKKCCRK